MQFVDVMLDESVDVSFAKLIRSHFLLAICRPKCDGFMVGSNKTDPALGTVNIVHEGPEECKLQWIVRSSSCVLPYVLHLMFPLQHCFRLIRQQHLAKGTVNVELHLRSLL